MSTLTNAREAEREPLTISDLVRLRGRMDPDREVVRFDEGSSTYRSLDARATAISDGLAACGVRPGQRVAVLLDTSVHAVEVWIALARLGCIEVPLSTALRGESLSFPLRQAKCTALITSGRFREQIETALPSVPELRKLIQVDDGAEVTDSRFDSYATLFQLPKVDVGQVEDEDPAHRAALILFSSGTTGAPKGVLLTHAAGFALARGVADAMSYNESDVLYNVFPLSHVNARFTTVLAAMLVNATAVLHQRFSASRFWTICRQEGITAFNYMGTLSALLLAQPADSHDRNHGVRKAYGAGTVGELRRSFSSRFNVAMVETYGSTELGMVAHTDLMSSPPDGSCGHITSDYTVAIHDPTGRPLPAGEIGEIVVRPTAPGQMFLEYFDNLEATVESWRDLWFHTGDRGYLDHDGWLYFADRLKDMIRRRGENISSWQVEQALLSHPAVAEACAVGVPSYISGEEVLVAFVLHDRADPAELIRHAGRHLPSYAVPRYVRLVDDLPKTASSRVQKYKVKAQGITADTWDAQARGDEIAL